jgi:hypothetical protein
MGLKKQSDDGAVGHPKKILHFNIPVYDFPPLRRTYGIHRILRVSS